MSGKKEKEISKSNKLSSKDCITLGIFSVIAFIIMLIAGITNLSPYTYLLYGVTYALFIGIFYLFVVTKIQKKGVVLFFNLVAEIYMFFTGVQGMIAAVTMILFSIIAEIILSKNYKSFKRILASYLCFIGWTFTGGEYRMFLFPEGYFKEALDMGLAVEYVDILRQLADIRYWVITTILTLIAGTLSILLGKKIINKYLVRSGIV